MTLNKNGRFGYCEQQGHREGDEVDEFVTVGKQFLILLFTEKQQSDVKERKNVQKTCYARGDDYMKQYRSWARVDFRLAVIWLFLWILLKLP
ncbi:hypothetical protein [Sporomusa termitida]|uniref:Uncharacterized protein n=1 Tax=Sporomusa termitida TaxID=2377 RepID=A0A517E1I2_9FIRM|nr:hypothetical protein [Sporomusa termitida]QDR83457.1 hypothetical protein SPTER_49480 [Sporomusa termitida]